MPAGFLRLLTLLALIAAQVIAAGRCAACATGCCAACTPCCAAPEPVAHESAGCALCGPAPHVSCCSVPVHDEPTRAPRSCTCQWEPRDDTPATAATAVTVDLDAVSPERPAGIDGDSDLTLLAHAAAARDIPQRPVRILLGVWRN